MVSEPNNMEIECDVRHKNGELGWNMQQNAGVKQAKCLGVSEKIDYVKFYVLMTKNEDVWNKWGSLQKRFQ